MLGFNSLLLATATLAAATGEPDVDLRRAGRAHVLRSEWGPAEAAFRTALARDLAASSEMEAARDEIELARLYRALDRFAIAADYARCARSRLERVAPGGRDWAATSLVLGQLAIDASRFAEAEGCLEEALAIEESHETDSLGVAGALVPLAEAVRERNVESAYQLLNRAIDIVGSLAPGSVAHAEALAGLAAVRLRKGDEPHAYGLYRQAHLIMEREAPRSLFAVWCLLRTGTTVRRLPGRTGEGALLVEAAHERLKALHPNGLLMASIQYGFATIEWNRANYLAARDHLEKSLSIRLGVDPSTLEVAMNLNSLGKVAGTLGDWMTAVDYQNRVIELRQKLLGPSHGELIEPLDLIASAFLNAGAVELAAAPLCRADDLLEFQPFNHGDSPDDRTRLRGLHNLHFETFRAWAFRECDVESLFQLTERSKGRALLSFLAESRTAGDAPASDRGEVRRLTREFDRVGRRLSQLHPERDAAEVDALLFRQQRVRDELNAAKARSRRPRLSPRVVTSDEMRSFLDPGTVLLSYFTSDNDGLFLLVLTADRGSLDVHRIDVGVEQLAERVEAMRLLLRAGQDDGKPSPALLRESAALYRLVLGPVEGILRDARRVLIASDRDLRSVPFAALVSRIDGERPTYWIEEKSIHYIGSASQYAELRRRAAGAHATELAAFGDPSYPPLKGDEHRSAGDARLRSAFERGLSFGPLPATRREVEAIARLFPARARVFLGNDATEENVKALADVRYLHLTGHGFIDVKMPIDSGLALSIRLTPRDDEDNGLLQAWEVFSDLRLNAELVTLSACDTAMGTDQRGEGYMGLTDAFLASGARSVLASLWKVSDESTSTLMIHFYRHLAAGAAKDDALRLAQLDMMKTNPHPFHWAAFRLTGDWR